MRTRLFYAIALILMIQTAVTAQFQRHVIVNNLNYHDLSIEPVTYGNPQVTDMMIGGNLFDAPLQNELMFLKKTDENGIVQWFFNYADPSSNHTRMFDFVVYEDLIFATGSVDLNGRRQVFIAQIEAISGSVLQAYSYDILGPPMNSVGLHIEYTNSDADGDGAGDPGFVVGGFFSDCYNVDINCTFNNIGFVMRTDFALNELWTTELDTSNTIDSQEYDFVNGMTETSDGFFITGSATGLNSGPNTIQQGVLAYKIDFMGNPVWNKSYIFGNSSDVSVDAYYEASTNKIYMLSNYSQTHYFGITTFDNSNGNIDPARSWYVTDFNNLNKYGFSLQESVGNPNNLVISGYDRDENWTIPGSSVYGESNVFVYEFAKANGSPAPNNFQYLVPNVEPATEDYNFWDFQMPIMYYPDITAINMDSSGVPFYYHVGYRVTDPTVGTVNMELIKTGFSKENTCDKKPINLTLNPLVKQDISVTSAHIPVNTFPMTLNRNVQAYVSEFCEANLGVQGNSVNPIKIYPNPVVNKLYVDSDNATDYQVYDLNGRLLAKGELGRDNSIEMSSFMRGMYLVVIETENTATQTFKVLKD